LPRNCKKGLLDLYRTDLTHKRKREIYLCRKKGGRSIDSMLEKTHALENHIEGKTDRKEGMEEAISKNFN